MHVLNDYNLKIQFHATYYDNYLLSRCAMFEKVGETFEELFFIGDFVEVSWLAGEHTVVQQRRGVHEQVVAGAVAQRHARLQFPQSHPILTLQRQQMFLHRSQPHIPKEIFAVIH